MRPAGAECPVPFRAVVGGRKELYSQTMIILVITEGEAVYLEISVLFLCS